jgi:hypothetical protein
MWAQEEGRQPEHKAIEHGEIGVRAVGSDC